MSVSIRFYRDQSHLPRVQASSEHSALADYLEGDLQDRATAEEVLSVIRTAAEDVQELSGNSYTTILNRDQVSLECLFDENKDPQTLPRAQFEQLVAAWADFLANENLISIVPDF